jgi:hypothetical protein
MQLLHPIHGHVPLDMTKPSFLAYHIMRKEMLDRQEDLTKNKGYMGLKSWLKEFCTLKFSMGRQQGTSTIINYNCHLYPEETLVIFNKLSMIYDHGEAKHYTYHGDDFENFFQRYRGTDTKFKYVFVDCAEFMKRKQLDSFYDAIIKYHPEVKLISLMQ